MTPMLETQLTVEDMLALQRFFLTQPAGRKPLVRQRLLRLPMFGIVGLAGYLGFDGSALSWVSVAVMGAAAIWTWFSIPMAMERAVRARAKTLYPYGVKPSEWLWIDGTGLNIESAGIRSRYAWGTIRKIDVTPTHAFIWVSEVQAIVVPRRIGEPQVQAFIEALRASSERMTPSQYYGPGAYGV